MTQEVCFQRQLAFIVGVGNISLLTSWQTGQLSHVGSETAEQD